MMVYLRSRTRTFLSTYSPVDGGRVSSRGSGVVGTDLDISLMDWSCEKKKEYGAEGRGEGSNMSRMMLEIRGGWNGLMERKGQTAMDQVCVCGSNRSSPLTKIRADRGIYLHVDANCS